MAGNYGNLPGFVYTMASDFEEDLSIKSGDEENENIQPRCFPEKDTLTMICDLTKINEQDLLNVIITKRRYIIRMKIESAPAGSSMSSESKS